MKKICIIFIYLLIVIGLSITAKKNKIDIENLTYLELKADIYKPVNNSIKIPVVFFAHNGFGKKEDWGDFPKQLANLGYLTISIGWEDFSTISDINKAIEQVLNKYSSIINTDKIAFIGGCHGAVKLLTQLDNKDLTSKINVKTAIAISISEEDNNMINATKNNKIPLLVIYAKNDKYGYSDINKKVAEELTGTPKKILAIDASPHGNEMLIDPDTKSFVSNEIIKWLKLYIK